VPALDAPARQHGEESSMTRSWDGAGHALCTSWIGALIAVAPS